MSVRAVHRYKIELTLLLVVTIWGTNFVLVKYILNFMHPHIMNVFRIISAGVVLSVLHGRRQKSLGQSFFEPLIRYPREIITIAVVGWWFYQMAFIIGLDNTSAGTAALIMASLPLWTALLSIVFGLERLTLTGWAGIAVTMAGTAVVVLSGGKTVELNSTYLIGNLIMLSATMLWSLNTVLTRKLVDRVTPVGITFLALIISIPLLALVSIPYWESVRWGEIHYLIWVAIFFSGSMSTGIAIVMWNYAIKTVGASHASAFQNLVPVIALIASFLVLDERIVQGQIIGGASTITGLLIMRRGRARKKRELNVRLSIHDGDKNNSVTEQSY